MAEKNTTKTTNKAQPQKTAAKKPAAKKTAAPKKISKPNYRQEKKSKVTERKRSPKTIAARQQMEESRSLSYLMQKYDYIWDIIAAILFFFSGVMVYSLAAPSSERNAAIWSVAFSTRLFGTVGLIFFLGMMIFCARFVLRHSQRFHKVPWNLFFYFLSLYAYALLIIQHNANKRLPPILPEDAAGYPMNFLDIFLTRILGEGGMVILFIFCAFLLAWIFWLYCHNRYLTMGEKDEVPVKVYWDRVFTAADAEVAAMDDFENSSLKTDIAEDFKSAVGLMTAEKKTPEPIGNKLRSTAENLKNTILEISKPVEPEAKPVRPKITEEEKTVEPQINEVPAKEKKQKAEPVLIRAKTVELDEDNAKVAVSSHDVTFVPTLKPMVNNSDKESSGSWKLPSFSEILDPVKLRKGVSPDDPAIQAQAEKIVRLLDTFGAPSEVVDIQCGPTFSQFGVEPGFLERGGRKTRVRIKQIEALRKDLEMELSVKQLAIEAPIPGKTYVGVQVQNRVRIPVTLREVLESDDFVRRHSKGLGIALGKDINGEIITADLTRMPHLLIAGATGSGKSVCLNALLACLLLHNTPAQLKLVLIDPKRVELTGYNGIPHLITPVVTDVEQVGSVLQWVLREMDMRNLHFMENGVRNIQEYNSKHPESALPYMVIVIDELANLMMEAASDIESSIIRLAQTARAMGIHLVVATQRPSRDVITGTIKGNLPTRIAFAVASYVDSQVILDRTGAENLFGKGDMYFLSPEQTMLKRLQCVYVSDDEIRRLVNYWRANSSASVEIETTDKTVPETAPQFVTEKVVRIPDLSNGTLTQMPLFNEEAPVMKKDGDILYDEAVKMVQRSGRASANMLVSRLSIGYSRANKLLARMEDEEIIGPPNANPAIPREILDYGEYGMQNEQ